MNLTRLAVLMGIGTAIAPAATLVFDNLTVPLANSQIGATSSTPNTYMGDGYILADGTTQITGFDVYAQQTSGINYTALQYNLFVWDTVNTGAVSAGSPAFSGLLGTFSGTFTGAFNTGFAYPLSITLPSPLSIADTTIGFAVNFQGTTDGTNFSSANNLTTVISFGSPASVGTNEFDGYFRNANSETDGNFTTGLHSIGQTDQSVGIRVYGNVAPEPGSAGLLVGGIGMLLIVYIRRQMAKHLSPRSSLP